MYLAFSAWKFKLPRTYAHFLCSEYECPTQSLSAAIVHDSGYDDGLAFDRGGFGGPNSLRGETGLHRGQGEEGEQKD